MPVDETITNKSSEETTAEDVRAILKAPPEAENPLVDPGIFDQKQPQTPIYKSIRLKFALAGVVALIVMVPAMRLFSGNLLSGAKPAKVASTKEDNKTETEEEKAQRLVAAENADLKRKLALQNQSFTAQEIEESAAPNGAAQTQQKPPAATAAARPSQQPVPVSRPVSAVASRPPETVRSLRSVPTARAISTPQRAAIPVASTAYKTPRAPVNLAEIAEAGNYGQLPSGASLTTASTQAMQPIVSTTGIPRFAALSNREVPFAHAGSIPVSIRREVLPAATEAVIEGADPRSRPMPTVLKDGATALAAVPKALAVVAEEEITLKDAGTDETQYETQYETQRDLILGTSGLPTLILPGSTAELEVNTALTWASDLPRALGSVTLASPLVSNGVAVLQKGTELIVQIGELSESGAVALNVVAMVLPSSGGLTEVNIPAGALEILALDGGYPVARAEQSSERQLQAIDRQQALLGAMGAAGDYLNRPERETSVFGIGGSSISREYGDGSLWGSLLSGAANELLRSRVTRLDAEAEQLMDRPTIWSIESGRQLQLFVTQEISL